MNDQDDEDEMVRFAAELSLMEDADLEWDPYNLESMNDKINQFEHVVDEHILTLDPKALDHLTKKGKLALSSEPISDAQINDIFGINRHSSGGAASATPRLSNRDSADSFDRLSLFSLNAFQDTPGPLNRQPSSMRNQTFKETAISIKHKIGWYQQKIIRQIEESQEVSLAPLFVCFFEFLH
jgi:hypothetical protein